MPPVSPSAPPPWWHALDPRRSLPARATLVGGGACLALVLLLAWSASTILQRQIERQLGPSFENLAHQVGDKLERTIYERYRQLQFTAGLAPFRTATTPAAERHAVLEALHDASPDYAWVGFADAKGNILAASQHLFENESANETAWFRGARRQPFVGTVHQLPELAAALPPVGSTPSRFLDLAVPVTAANGQFLGVLGAQLRWAWAREVQLSVVPDAARRDLLGVTIYSSAGEVMLDSGGSGWTEPPDAPAHLTSARGTLTEHAAGGTAYVTGFARTRGYREYRGLAWLVVVRQPVANAFAPVAELRTRILRLGLGLVVALGVLVWFCTARLDRRLRAIATAAGRIGAGDVLTLMPQPRGDTELARTCAALGDMVGKFRQRQETLETENARLAARPRD